jgi:signal transduction histidine kinase
MKKERVEASALRKNAEENLAKKNSGYSATSEGDAVRLIHELEVHKVELEMQNEELREAIDIAEAATARFTMLYDFAPNGYFTLDNECFIRELNFSGALMLCKERASLISTNFKNFIGFDSCDAFNDFYRKILETCTKQTCEVSLAIQDNLLKYVYLEGISSEGQQGCLITAIDLTERQKANEALKESEARLRDLNATKDKFFSIIAHDLRGPFTTIIGFSGLLMSQVQLKNIEGIEKYAAYIQQSSQRAMNLLTNLLEWARLQIGKIKFNPDKIQISEIVEEITELLKDTAQQNQYRYLKRFREIPMCLPIRR